MGIANSFLARRRGHGENSAPTVYDVPFNTATTSRVYDLYGRVSTSPHNRVLVLPPRPSSSRWTTPLIVCFIIPAVVIPVLFFTLTWILLSQSTEAYVDSSIDSLHRLAELSLETSIQSFTTSVSTKINLILGPLPFLRTVDEIISFLFETMVQDREVLAVTVSLTNGNGLMIKRLSNASLALGMCPSDFMSLSPCQNMSFWALDSSGGKIGFPIYSIPFAVASSTSTVLVKSTDETILVTSSVAHATFSSTLQMEFSTQRITNGLAQMCHGLSSHSTLLLLANDSEPILSHACDGTAKLSALDIERVQQPSVSFGWSVGQFDGFGKSHLLKKAVVGLPSNTTWALFALLPQSDVYDVHHRNNRILVGLTASGVSAFILATLALYYCCITLPMRRLRGHMLGLLDVMSHRRDAACFKNSSSMFTEFAVLYQGLAELVRAADDRIVESRTQERMHHFEETQDQIQSQRSKEMFFAIMSHEMRTPLTACIGMAEILLGTPLSTRQRECAEAIAFSGTNLLALINDVLDFSKLEAEKLVLECIPFCVRECIEHAAQALQLKSEEKDLELIISISPRVPDQTMGDPARLSQVLLNLLSNAIKFTSTGHVRIGCYFESETERMHFYVEDTGIGLEPEVIPRLFQPFVQAEASMTRKFGGTGLGLVISQRIIKMMDGVLEASSDGDGKGSTFTFSIPFISPAPSPTHRRRTITHFSSLSHRPSLCESVAGPPGSLPFSATLANDVIPTVVVVDPNDLRRHATCDLLRALRIRFAEVPHVSVLASSPTFAAAPIILTYIRDYASECSPFLQAIRQLPPLPQETEACNNTRRLVFITRLKSSLCVTPRDGSFCISKPITLSKLREVFERLMPAPSPKPSLQHSAPIQSSSALFNLVALEPSAARILVVDDVTLNQRVITMKLQQRGYQNIDVAASGQEAIDKVRSAVVSYDAILMDVMMPVMDGLEATRRILAHVSSHSIPIIGVTGNCSTEDVDHCLQAGMVAVLAKPIDTDHLFQVLQSVLAPPPVRVAASAATHDSTGAPISSSTIHEPVQAPVPPLVIAATATPPPPPLPPTPPPRSYSPIAENAAGSTCSRPPLVQRAFSTDSNLAGVIHPQ